jgi:hypothetical protein
MNKIENTLGLRPISEALADVEGTAFDDAYNLPEEFMASLDAQINQADDKATQLAMLNGDSTSKELDTLYHTLTDKAETLAELAMELEPGKAPRAFEVMNQIYKNAMDAVTAKRDFELKAMKLMLEREKLEMDRGLNTHQEDGPKVVSVITTADLIRQYRKDIEDAKEVDARTTPTDK